MGNIPEMILSELNTAMFGQKRLKHLFVLFLTGTRQVGQAAGGYAKIHRDSIRMELPNSVGDPENHFVAVFVLNNFIDQGQNGASPSIKYTPAANANNVDVRKEIGFSLNGRGCHDPLIHERLARERALYVGSGFILLR